MFACFFLCCFYKVLETFLGVSGDQMHWCNILATRISCVSGDVFSGHHIYVQQYHYVVSGISDGPILVMGLCSFASCLHVVAKCYFSYYISCGCYCAVARFFSDESFRPQYFANQFLVFRSATICLRHTVFNFFTQFIFAGVEFKLTICFKIFWGERRGWIFQVSKNLS